MFDSLFTKAETLTRHLQAPYAEERARYLAHCAQHGYTRHTLLFKARELLWVARKLQGYPDLQLTQAQLEDVAQDWQAREQAWGQRLSTAWTRRRFIEVARPWLRFLGTWRESRPSVPFAQYLTAFVEWMRDERGLAATTIERRADSLRQFLQWYGSLQRPFSAIHPTDIDAFLAQGSARGWRRVTVNNRASALRAFFRYGAQQHWCPPSLAAAVLGPRVFAQEPLPVGPAWTEVQRLLAHLETDDPLILRDRAILLLVAFYGLRASEVAGLRLDHLDWQHDRLHVPRMKRSVLQPYPFLPVVGNAITRYLREARPQRAHPQLFLSQLPPWRPLSRSAIYSVARRWLDALGIACPRRGPHALRHACATYLLGTGFSLKEIGDHLGHQSTEATRIYAKVDLPRLREVARFDLGGVL